MWRCVAIALLLICLEPAAAQQPRLSIDCAGARSAAAKVICSDSRLISFEQDMSDAYNDALLAGKVGSAAQAKWLRRLDAACARGDQRECLRRRLQLRTAALYSAAGAGPSFDCDKARSAPEYAICTDPSLAQLDLVLARAYRHALDTNKIGKASQLAWIRQRDEGCLASRAQQQSVRQREDDLIGCLADQMQQRLAELQSVYGFAYGTASCSRHGAVSIAFDIPPVPATYLLAEYGTIFPDRLFSWRCDPDPQTSITVKYGFDPNGPCGTLSLWRNGIKVARQLPIAQCGYDVTLQSVTLTASGLTVCYLAIDPASKSHCDPMAQSALPTAKDPYFVAGPLPGEPEPAPVQIPMRQLEGKSDPRCAIFANRLAENWNDDLSDLEAKIAWRKLEFPGEQFPGDAAVGQFDIDNDGQTEVVVRQEEHSHASEGERYTILPANSWIRDASAVPDHENFHAEIQGKGHTLPNPFFSSSEHDSVRVLAAGGRTVMLARPIVYRPPAKSWETSDSADSPERIFFEVQKGGTIKAICSFAGPYYPGAEL
jgi:uncharacterized protein